MNGKTSPAAAENSQRAAYIKGLRALADTLEQHDELPLPARDGGRITWSFLGDSDAREQMAVAARAIPCNWRKDMWGQEKHYFDLNGELHGLPITLGAYRDDVCERIVTGTHEETKTVKDPEALAAVPEVRVTETVEDIEWRCGSLLAPEGPATA